MTTFKEHVWQRRHSGLVNTTFHFPTFKEGGRVHAYYNKARMDYRQENLLQARLNKFAVAAIDRDSVIIDLAYLIAGLVTITQSRLVHRMLQGVEHTDPTEWSNSHLSIGDKFVLTVQQAVSIFKSCSLFLFNDYFVIHFEYGSSTFYTIECTGFVPKWFSLHIRIICCLRTARSHTDYISTILI